MRTTIVIREGRTQIALTPETQLDEAALKQIESDQGSFHVYRASFYDTRGGWTREEVNGDRSLLIVSEPLND